MLDAAAEPEAQCCCEGDDARKSGLLEEEGLRFDAGWNATVMMYRTFEVTSLHLVIGGEFWNPVVRIIAFVGEWWNMVEIEWWVNVTWCDSIQWKKHIW